MSSWILLGVAWKSTAVLCLAWILASCLRSRSAAARHAVWTAAVAAVLALPLLSVSLPALPVPVVGGILPSDGLILFQAGSTAAADSLPAAQSSGGSRHAIPNGRPLSSRWNLTGWLLALWAGGAALSLLKMLLSFGAMWRIRREARPYAQPEVCASVARKLGIQHEVEALEIQPGGMPMAFGLLRPAIFLPVDAAAWTEERRRMVLLHELAHVRRGDLAAHLLARTALSFYWWNPLAWLAWRESLKERERAADDLVLTAGERPAEYAGHLLDVARMHAARTSSSASLAMARRSELEGRLLAILDADVNRRPTRGTAVLAAALLAVVLAAPFAAMKAQSPASQAIAPDVEATIRAANSQRNPDLLDRAATVFQQQHRYHEAQTLLEASLAIRGENFGEYSKEYQAGLVKLGDLAAAQGKNPLAYYMKAVALGDSAEVGGALLYLGISSLKDDSAMDYLQRAVNVSGSGPVAAKALTWMAVARQKKDGFGPEVAVLFANALSMEAPNSPESALTRELYARSLREQSQTGEADALASQAAAVRKLHAAELSPKRADSSPAEKFTKSAADELTRPVLIEKLEPSYTQEARAEKVQGSVKVQVEIGVDGLCYNMQILEGVGFGLDEAAISAISQWKFQPGLRNGQPVPMQATIEVNFHLL
jgi:TonB family protein